MTILSSLRDLMSKRRRHAIRHVLFTQPVVPSYRVALFEKLQDELSGNGYTLTVAYSRRPDSEARNSHSVDLYRWSTCVTSSSRKLFGASFYYRDIAQLWKPGSLLITELGAGNLNAWMAACCGRPFVLMGHGKAYVTDESALSRIAETWLCKFATHVLVYMPSGRSAVLGRARLPSWRVSTFYNSTDTKSIVEQISHVTDNDIQDFCDSIGLARGGRIGIYVGALEPYKNIDLLLEAAERAFEADSRCALVVVGVGSLVSNVLEFTARYPGRAAYCSAVGPSEWAILSKLGHLVIVPGRVGLVATDSLAAGLPVLTTNYAYHAPEIEYLDERGVVIRVDETAESIASTWVETDWAAIQCDGELPTIENSVQIIARTVVGLTEDCS